MINEIRQRIKKKEKEIENLKLSLHYKTGELEAYKDLLETVKKEESKKPKEKDVENVEGG